MALLDRVLSWLGLDFDVEVSGSSDARSAITESLFVGRRPGPDDIDELRAAGITHVFSCLEGPSMWKVSFLEADFWTRVAAARDAMDEDITRLFPAFFEFADEAHAEGGKLLVHCEAGVSRSATLATAQLMRAKRQPFFAAYRELKAMRPGVLPNIGFASQLQRYEDELLDRAPGEPSSLARYLREACQVPAEVELLDELLARHDQDAQRALRAIFGDIPRVVQGVRR